MRALLSGEAFEAFIEPGVAPLAFIRECFLATFRYLDLYLAAVMRMRNAHDISITDS